MFPDAQLRFAGWLDARAAQWVEGALGPRVPGYRSHERLVYNRPWPMTGICLLLQIIWWAFGLVTTVKIRGDGSTAVRGLEYSWTL